MRPTGIAGFVSVTAIDTSTAEVTVNVVVPEMPLDASVARIVVAPTATLVASPPLTVATPMLVELHVAAVVRFCVVLSLNVPVAVNCSVNPIAIDGFVGTTAIDMSTADVTVNVVVPKMPLDASVARIVVAPTATLVASPPPTVATPTSVELHVAVVVRFCVVLSLNVPVAVNCSVKPTGIAGFVGVTSIDTSCAEVTVSVVVPTSPVAWSTAVMTVDPLAMLVTRPALPGTLPTAAIPALDELHSTTLVRSSARPFLSIALAVSCCEVPRAIIGLAGVITRVRG